MRRGCWTVGLTLWLLAACERDRRYGPEDNPTTVTDVSGVEFGWTCDDRGCGISYLAATPAPNPCGETTTPGYSYAWGRFFEICSVCASEEPGLYWSTTPGECRILACETDADCPAIYEFAQEDGYACVNGLCQNADTARFPRDSLRRSEVTQLCYAVHPRADTASPFSPTTQAVQDEVEAACPGATVNDPCALPAACRMP